jgi:hypothetical protein
MIYIGVDFGVLHYGEGTQIYSVREHDVGGNI